MVKFIFENKRLTKNISKVVLTDKKVDKAHLKNFLSDDEIEVLTKRIKQSSGQFEVLDSKSEKIIAVVMDSKNKSQKYDILGGKLYKLIKNEREAAIYLNVHDESSYQMALGIELASYSFDKYVTKRDEKDFPKLETVYFKNKKYSLSSKMYEPYAALATGVRYARDLTNEPSNNMTPHIMADDIKRLEYLGLKVDILNEVQMKEKEFNLALSVAQGSQNKPRIAIIKWQGKDDSDNFDIGLVGKGVTFDSGGISLKPGSGMWDMKQDMAGAAAVVGAFKTAALQKLKINAVGVVGLVENMPSGSATRPGDIVRSMSGQTVEILNTDAEGRLVLADCLWYIQNEFKVKKVVDIATLTGAIIVALGTEMAGVMGNNQAFIDQIKKAGQKSGEEVWQLPLNKAYNKMMDSDIADMKNISESRNAGSITAACFLERFIKKGIMWAHLDIAGMDKETKGKPLTPKGATGFGVRLFNEFMKNL